MPDMYKLGASSALARLGLADKDESHTLRNVAVGGAAASPFFGLLGQKKQIHNPEITPGARRLSLAEIEQMARHGDVVLSGRAGGGFKESITGTSTPHAEVVLGRRGGKAIGVTPGEFVPEQLRRAGVKNPALAEAYARYAGQIERNPKAIQRLQRTLGDRLDALGQKRVILLRPETPLTPTQLKSLREVGYREAAKPWSATKGFLTTLRDWFVPKHKLFNAINPRKGQLCTGNICTTQAGKALEAGGVSEIAAGKRAKDLVATDFLSSDKLKMIGHYEHPGLIPKLSPAARKALHYGARGALGLGLAGSTYALSEDPYLATAPIGAFGAAAGARKLFGHQNFRPLKAGLFSPAARRGPRLRNIGTRTLPLMLAGGLGTYLGTKALSSLFDKKS